MKAKCFMLPFNAPLSPLRGPPSPLRRGRLGIWLFFERRDKILQARRPFLKALDLREDVLILCRHGNDLLRDARIALCALMGCVADPFHRRIHLTDGVQQML